MLSDLLLFEVLCSKCYTCHNIETVVLVVLGVIGPCCDVDGDGILARLPFVFYASLYGLFAVMLLVWLLALQEFYDCTQVRMP